MLSSDWTRVRSSGGVWLYWLLNTVGDWSSLSLLVVLLVMFPDGLAGRPPRQRRISRVLLVTAACGTATAVLATSARSEDGTLIANPHGIALLPQGIVDAADILVLGTLLVAFVQMVARYRSATTDVRLQYRWVLSAIAVVVASLFIGLAGNQLTRREGVSGGSRFWSRGLHCRWPSWWRSCGAACTRSTASSAARSHT
ncbi:MAG TPA: hypothetical protein VK923_02375 [Euzebyales bacterium]|nr:hypothetical protein [Euzebyales bacterium]